MTQKQGEKIVVGLDIGSTKVCAVAGRLIRDKNHARLDVLGVGKAHSEGVAKGAVVNINKTVDAINQAINEASRQANLDIKVVNVGFSSQNISARRQHGSITRSSPGEEVNATDVAHLLGDMYRSVIPAGYEIVHVLPMDFIVDNETVIDDPVGRIGVKLEADFQVITAQINAAANTRKCIERSSASLQKDLFLLSPLASAMAVLRDEEKQAGVVLVDIGGGTTDIAIYYRNVLRHVAVLPYAGNTITSDIQEGCKVLPQQAEVLKTKFGSSNPGEFQLNEVVSVPVLAGRMPKDVMLKNVALIIEARLKEIAAMVQAEVVRSGYKDKLLGGIVLTGGTSAIRGIEELFERVTGLHTRVGAPELLEYNVKADLVSDPALATAVGLVWAGFKSLDERVDVAPGIPEETPVRQPTGRPAPPREKEKEKEGGSFWGRLLSGVKTFMTDSDIGNSDKYDR